MNISLKSAISISLTVFAALCAINIYPLFNSGALPKIQGVIIPNALELSEFTLIDHNNKPFTRSSLQGNWYLLSYGYTDCPDICPTTLSIMSRVERRLQKSGKFDDLQMLFYTIDPERDTVEQLSKYVTFFGDNFVGLTHGNNLKTNHLPFEQSLGMVSALTPLPEDERENDFKGYSVSHGVVLYLLNSEGKLQAILKPEITVHGAHFFETDKVYRDYISIREFFG